MNYDPEDEEDAGTSKWYVFYSGGSQKCVQDCKSGGECGGLANSWDELYDSKTECCKEKDQWTPLKDCLAKK